MNEQFNEHGPFAIGEIVQLRNDPKETEPCCEKFEGADVEIVGPLAQHELHLGNQAFYYEVRTKCGVEILAGPHELHRRKPPTTYTGEQRIKELIRELSGKPPASSPLRLAEPPPERRISAGWMRDYDRAQALMAAGVSVQRVWPVLVEAGA